MMPITPTPPTPPTQDTTLPLGKASSYPDRYDRSLLYPISRALGRQCITGIARASEWAEALPASLPFMGWDLWRGYELSWLLPSGLPQVAILNVWVPCGSPCIVESKSFKLYLNSLNSEVFESTTSLAERIGADLTPILGQKARISIITADQFAQETLQEPTGVCLDNQEVMIDRYQPDARLLEGAAQGQPLQEQLYSRLLKSNCPVTNQPDWACVQIAYEGPAISHQALLRYIVSYREHQGFHEQCVEQIFCDIMAQCQPTRLSVYAQYTRRGGIDINPWRATPGMPEPCAMRSAQQ
jgi:7-cyano-7-deazaguanine reductase